MQGRSIHSGGQKAVEREAIVFRDAVIDSIVVKEELGFREAVIDSIAVKEELGFRGDSPEGVIEDVVFRDSLDGVKVNVGGVNHIELGAHVSVGNLVLEVATMMADLGDLPGGGDFILGVNEIATPLPLVPFQEGALRTMPAALLPEGVSRKVGAERLTEGSTGPDRGYQGCVVVASGRAGFDEGGRGGVRVRGAHGAEFTDATFFTFFCIFLTF